MYTIFHNPMLARLALAFLITFTFGCTEFGKDGESSSFGGGMPPISGGSGSSGSSNSSDNDSDNGGSDADENENDQDNDSDDDPSNDENEGECRDVTFSGSTWWGEDDTAGETEICSYPVITALSSDSSLSTDDTADYELRIEVEGKGVMITGLGFQVTVVSGDEDWVNQFDESSGPESTLTGVSSSPTRAFWAFGGTLMYDFSAGGDFAWFGGDDYNMPGFEIDYDEDETITFRFDPDGQVPEDVEVEIELFRVAWLSLDDNLIVSLHEGFSNDHLVGLGTDDLSVTYTYEVDGSGDSDDEDEDDTSDDEDTNDFSFYYNPPGSSTDVDIYVTVILPNGSWAFNGLARSVNNVDTVYVDKNHVPVFEDLPEDSEVIVNAENDGGWPSGTHGCMGSSLNGGWTGYWPNTSGTQFWPISNGGSGCDSYAKAGSTSNPGFSYNPY